MVPDKVYKPGERWDELEELRNAYPTFQPFLYDVMTDLMGFECSDIQLDIALYLEDGPLYRMIQAQRGQAKTTITAAYAVWCFIHKPAHRVLIVSAGGDFAAEISNWVIQIILGMPELECLRPDRSQRDRMGTEAFDVHHELKGPEKSPSLACIGIGASMQGRRADLLIADDVESSKNSETDKQRQRLMHLTRDFTSICSKGDIVYLGTPQSVESIYNSLASRGYDIRIWPGRYPTLEEEEQYGDMLAPLLRQRMEADPELRTGGGPTGRSGKVIDPVLLPEDVLCKKEVDQGTAYFQLQYMLNTALTDAERFPLKSNKLIFMRVPTKHVPLEIGTSEILSNLIALPHDWVTKDKYYRADELSSDLGTYTQTHMYVDPAGGGQNGDETAYAVVRNVAGYVFLVDFGGVPGGLGKESLKKLTSIAAKWEPEVVSVEKNFGNGALCAIWQPMLLKEHRCRIEEPWESGQKELRIIDTLEPIVNNGRLIVDESLLMHDRETCKDYPIVKRNAYSFFYQFSRITRDRGALAHDDRLDAVAGACRPFTKALQIDNKTAVEKARRNAYKEMVSNPLGNGRPLPGWQTMVRRGLQDQKLTTRNRNAAVIRMRRKV